jgi:TRAP-type C4-dicarboxylate transport system permease small subunit
MNTDHRTVVNKMTREPAKMAKVFIALISVAAFAVALFGGIFVYHQQVIEEKSGLWEPVVSGINDATIPVLFDLPITHHINWIYPLSSLPP